MEAVVGLFFRVLKFEPCSFSRFGLVFLRRSKKFSRWSRFQLHISVAEKPLDCLRARKSLIFFCSCDLFVQNLRQEEASFATSLLAGSFGLAVVPQKPDCAKKKKKNRDFHLS